MVHLQPDSNESRTNCSKGRLGRFRKQSIRKVLICLLWTHLWTACLDRGNKAIIRGAQVTTLLTQITWEAQSVIRIEEVCLKLRQIDFRTSLGMMMAMVKVMIKFSCLICFNLTRLSADSREGWDLSVKWHTDSNEYGPTLLSLTST